MTENEREAMFLKIVNDIGNTFFNVEEGRPMNLFQAVLDGSLSMDTPITLEVEDPSPEVLPPKEYFINNLKYLLDLTDATIKEREVMNKLIERFNV